MARTPVLPKATLVGPLSALLRHSKLSRLSGYPGAVRQRYAALTFGVLALSMALR